MRHGVNLVVQLDLLFEKTAETTCRRLRLRNNAAVCCEDTLPQSVAVLPYNVPLKQTVSTSKQRYAKLQRITP